MGTGFKHTHDIQFREAFTEGSLLDCWDNVWVARVCTDGILSYGMVQYHIVSCHTSLKYMSCRTAIYLSADGLARL